MGLQPDAGAPGCSVPAPVCVHRGVRGWNTDCADDADTHGLATDISLHLILNKYIYDNIVFIPEYEIKPHDYQSDKR